jgi:transcriptional regulator with XRE-family HTH domain
MEMNERERIGALLAKKRNEAGLSVRALAELAGVSYQNITKIENGKYNVSIDILSKIVNALNCKIDISNI